MGKESLETQGYSTLELFITRRIRLLDDLHHNSELRFKFLEYLYLRAREIPQDSALAAIVLGTSINKFPQKFRNRIEWAVHLYRNRKIDLIIFTGTKDHEDNQIVDQAVVARDLAISEFQIPPKIGYLAGGTNTQENLTTAAQILGRFGLRRTPVFIVSENEHLIRSMTAAAEELTPRGIIAYPHPVGGIQKLDPDDPRVTIELIKAVGYNRVLYRIPDTFNSTQQKIIRVAILEKIKEIEDDLRPGVNAKVDKPIRITPNTRILNPTNPDQYPLAI